ncbi:GAF and ANTAR domain-containing protein [Micromonospora zhanjiangensis]|uniref:GAF and ANTAR domain-containing protein n=1 Tax=Micromonospora zhanjiangensis TaxID=1522057 RepID=A0ABV8KTC5_9ACTN
MRLGTHAARDATHETLGVLETAALLRELTAGLIRGTDFDAALDQVVRTCRTAVAGVTWSSVTVLRAGQPATVAVSDESLRDLDALRPGEILDELPTGPAGTAVDEFPVGPAVTAGPTYVEPASRPGSDGPAYDGDGPVLTAIRRRELVLIPDLRTGDHWSAWRHRALALGVHGVLVAPFDVDEQVIGAVSLYSREPARLTPSRQLTAMLLAEHAGLLLAGVRDRARQAAAAGELDESLIDGVLGQAIGVIMTQRGCPAPEALQVLRTASTALSIPVREVAERLVASVARNHPTGSAS